jgi:hypothetical protein
MELMAELMAESLLKSIPDYLQESILGPMRKAARRSGGNAGIRSCM